MSGLTHSGPTILDPVIRRFLEMSTALTGAALHTLPLHRARQLLEEFQSGEFDIQAATSTADVVLHVVTGKQIPVRIVRPERADGLLPAIIYCHGGGWVMGSPRTHDRLIRELAAGSDAAVVFVDYDHAPEAQYPVQHDQVYEVAEYLAAHGNTLGIDGSRLAIAGDGAGGNIAASTCLKAKQRGGPTLLMQVLFYPVIAAISDNASYTRYSEGPWLTAQSMAHFQAMEFPRSALSDPLAFPSLASTAYLAGVPEALILVAEHDILRDEGEAYARKLEGAGVRVTSLRFNGAIHDFVMLNALRDSPPTRAAINQACSALKRALHQF